MRTLNASPTWGGCTCMPSSASPNTKAFRGPSFFGMAKVRETASMRLHYKGIGECRERTAAETSDYVSQVSCPKAHTERPPGTISSTMKWLVGVSGVSKFGK